MMYFENFRMDEDVKCFHNFLKGILKSGFVNKKKNLGYLIYNNSIVLHWKVCIFYLKKGSEQVYLWLIAK